MLHNPFFIEVQNCGHCRTLELIPVYRKAGDRYVATKDFRVYNAYVPDVDGYLDGDALKEQYFDNLEIMGDDNPCFLGELQFRGVAYFEWRYVGEQLNIYEVWQIVDLMQNATRTYV
jgi:hypothetical protein